MVPVGQGNAAVTGAPCCRGDARDNLEWNPVTGEEFDLLPAAAENEWIPPFQPRNPPSGAGVLHQQAVDVPLGHGVTGPLLAHVDHFRFGVDLIEYAVRYQAIVEHHFRLLQQSPGAEGEQVRVAGAGTDQVCLSPGAVAGCFLQLPFKQRLRQTGIAGKNAFGHVAGEGPFPEPLAVLGIRELLPDRVTVSAHQSCKVSVPRRDQGIDPVPQQLREQRRGAAAGDRNRQGLAVNDAGKSDVRLSGVGHHVDRYVPFTGHGCDSVVDPGIIRGRHHQDMAVGPIVGLPGACDNPAAGRLDSVPERWIDVRSDDIHDGAGPEHGPCPPGRDPPAAHQQAAAVPDIEKERKMIHQPVD